MLRRTKDSKLENGKSIIDLPILKINTLRIDLSPEEKTDYDQLLSFSKEKYSLLLRGGKLKTYVTCIFGLLLRLRQYCDHPYLIMSRSDVTSQEDLEGFLKKNSSNVNPKYIEVLYEKIKNGEDTDCPVC